MSRKNNVLIVLGMHRSGTSVTAQWLHACGLHLGKRLIGASVGNEKGHFEDLDFHDLHEEIFRANRVSYGGLRPASQLTISNRQKAKFKSLIDRKNSQNITWGLKDPRICLFTDIYESLIDEPTYLVVYREANDVVNSILNRLEEMLSSGYYYRRIADRLRFWLIRKGVRDFSAKKIDREHLECWIRYNQKILNLTGRIGRDRCRVIHYSRLLKDSGDVISWLNERGFDLENVPYEEIFDHDMISSQVPTDRIGKDLRDRVTCIERQFRILEEEH